MDRRASASQWSATKACYIIPVPAEQRLVPEPLLSSWYVSLEQLECLAIECLAIECLASNAALRHSYS